MSRKRWLSISFAAWFSVGAFWLALTHRFHPTFSLALLVTTSLISAYAGASYVNHLVLIPRFWRQQKRWQYFIALVATMSCLTAVALAIIRFAYVRSLGPDPDPNGLYKHYAIDLFGMTVHTAAATVAVQLTRKHLH